MLEFIKMINSDYSGVLSLLSSVIMVIVTIAYVGHTKRQANYAKESVDLVTRQLKIEKQPCIVPKITGSYGSAFNATDYTRIQLGFDITLKNFGDAPAINIYTLADIELQFTYNANGEKALLSAALLPKFTQAISTGEEAKIDLHFETAEVKLLVEELEKSQEMNWERIRRNPTQHHYTGAKLIIRVLFKNTMGQWCESSLSHEIAWLECKNPPQRRTHNINENTIPPKIIQEGDKFRAVLSGNHIAPFTYRMISETEATSILKNHQDDSPWLLESIENDLSALQ